MAGHRVRLSLTGCESEQRENTNSKHFPTGQVLLLRRDRHGCRLVRDPTPRACPAGGHHLRSDSGRVIPGLSRLARLRRSHRRRAPTGRRRFRTCISRCWRPCLGHRCQGSADAWPHSTGAALRHRIGPPMRDGRIRGPRRPDRGDASRHWQAGDTSTHSFETGSPGAVRVRDGENAPEGRRRHRGIDPVSVPGHAADLEPPRAVGRQGLPRRTEGRGYPARGPSPGARRLLRRGDDRTFVPSCGDL